MKMTTLLLAPTVTCLTSARMELTISKRRTEKWARYAISEKTDLHGSHAAASAGRRSEGVRIPCGGRCADKGGWEVQEDTASG
ncbi:unnamed protein product [Toxocara canis]|uniref:Secreted protein n=1 Tax=Toxocara canis TaxID=6265 RepID=A0A183V5X9_TOXCA|nr:unnamed protein product [Toxocara canis]